MEAPACRSRVQSMLRGAASAPATSFPLAASPLSLRTNAAWRFFAAAEGLPTDYRVLRAPQPPAGSAPLLRRGSSSTQPRRSGRRPFPAPPPARPSSLPEPGRATSAERPAAALPSSGNRPLRPPAPGVREAKGDETEEGTETENGRASHPRRDGRAPGRRARPRIPVRTAPRGGGCGRSPRPLPGSPQSAQRPFPVTFSSSCSSVLLRSRSITAARRGALRVEPGGRLGPGTRKEELLGGRLARRSRPSTAPGVGNRRTASTGREPRRAASSPAATLLAALLTAR